MHSYETARHNGLADTVHCNENGSVSCHSGFRGAILLCSFDMKLQCLSCPQCSRKRLIFLKLAHEVYIVHIDLNW